MYVCIYANYTTHKYLVKLCNTKYTVSSINIVYYNIIQSNVSMCTMISTRFLTSKTSQGRRHRKVTPRTMRTAWRPIWVVWWASTKTISDERHLGGVFFMHVIQWCERNSRVCLVFFLENGDKVCLKQLVFFCFINSNDLGDLDLANSWNLFILLTLQYLLVIHRKAWLWNNTENMGAGNPYSQ